jgi:mono/diheme cytochrome c family protein
MNYAPIAAALCLMGITGTACTAARSAPAATVAATSPFLPGTGQRQVTAACAACHPPTIITTKHYSEEKWAQLVEQMISRGAKVSDADFDLVVDYLARNYGEAKP